MCELLGMSANVPTDICFSFKGLVKRGGEKGPHKDGWGITFYEGKGCRSFKDPMPCSFSPIAKLVEEYPIKSTAVIGHIRQANRGNISLENTHPFTRELWGKNWTFAHNGQLTDYERLDIGSHQPVGQTDSEYAFCYILAQLQKHYQACPQDWVAVFNVIKQCADYLSTLGICNLLISDGRFLFAFCSTNLHWITRKAPFGKAKLLDEDVEIDFQQHTSPSDVVTMIATMPLTSNEVWHKIEPNHAKLFENGEIVF